MLIGTCHCGAVGWSFDGLPDAATACNCTVCRRYGVLWAYGFEGERISLTGPLASYTRTDLPTPALEFLFCAGCGCVVSWRSLTVDKNGRRAIAVNLRLTEPDPVAHVPISHFDGLERFKRLPHDGRRVADHWF